MLQPLDGLSVAIQGGRKNDLANAGLMEGGGKVVKLELAPTRHFGSP